MKVNIIAIDGPASSGKSTVAKMVADQIGWRYVTTGAIYRALALLLSEKNLRENYLPEIKKFTSILNTTYRQEPVTGQIFLDERDITNAIKNPVVSEFSSVLGEEKKVREALLPLQRKIVMDSIDNSSNRDNEGSARLNPSHGAVVEGRDIGTVVFPNACLKIFLTASAEERANRRSEELKRSGKNLELHELIKEIHERDERDSNRTIAPLKVAEDALVIDSTKLNLQQIVNEILKLALKKNLY